MACQTAADRAATAREAGQNSPHTAAAEGCGRRTAAAGEDTAVAAGIAAEDTAEEGTVGEAGSLSRVMLAVIFIGRGVDRLRILPRCCPDPA